MVRKLTLLDSILASIAEGGILSRDSYFFLAGVLLAIPLSVAANLATPRVRDWLASSSSARLHKRIETLKEQLAARQRPLVDYISLVVIYLGGLIVAVFCVVFGVAIPGWMHQGHPVRFLKWATTSPELLSQLYIFMGLVAFVLSLQRLSDINKEFRRAIPGSRQRCETEKRLAGLQAKLARRK